MLGKLLVPGLLLAVMSVANEAASPQEAFCKGVVATKETQLPAPLMDLPSHANRPYFEMAVLGWAAKQEGNDYAATGSAITVPGTSDPNTGLVPLPITSSGHVYAPNTSVRPGFKVEAGINLAHGEWSLFSEYTWFFGKSTSSVATDDLNAGIVPLFSYSPNNSILSGTTFSTTSGATGFVSSAKAYWTLHFNNINLELKKEMSLFSMLTLVPHFGFQGTWQKQIFKASYDVSSWRNATSLLGGNQVLFSQTSWGLGLRAGLDTVWKCCNHLGLFANTAVSALWGQFKARAKSYDTNFSLGYTNVLIANQLDSLYTISPVLQAMVGVQLDWNLSQKYLLLAQVGWEEQVWFFQNNHSSTIADTSLILQGLTAKLVLDF